MRLAITGLLLFGFAASARAQSNTIDGLNLYLHVIDNPVVMGRSGTFPNGTVAISHDTDVCNTGTIGIQWHKAMNPDHPFIAYIIAREENGRLEQISNRSFVKHNFGAANSSACATCTDNSDSSVLAIGCSDTYGSAENGDRYWLGPAEEIDPWLGTWDPNCSYFDHGDPPVAPPADCDGKRSLTHGQVRNMDPIQNRCLVTDADLNMSGDRYFYYAMYMVIGEADANRDDTSASREFIPTWTGSSWSLQNNGAQLSGTVLQNWTGATVHSNSNGGDDGRVFLASNVTGPDANGLYHYEYALHNRDNSRAIAALQIPICPGATIVNAGFRDIDTDSTNDWTFATSAGDATWTSNATALEWNTIYNFWFDSDMAPSDARSLVYEARSGAGLPAFDVVASAPLGPSLATDLGSGKTGGNGLVPELTLCGGLDLGDTADLMVRYAAPSALSYAFISDQNSGLNYRGGTIIPYPPVVIVVTVTDAAGELLYPLDGVGGSFDVFLQFLVEDPAAAGGISLTNALEVVH